MGWLGQLWSSAKNLGGKALRGISSLGGKALDIGDQVLKYGKYIAPFFGPEASAAVLGAQALMPTARKAVGYAGMGADVLEGKKGASEKALRTAYNYLT